MKRLDSALVEWGIAPSRTKAQTLIDAGEIEILKNGEWFITKDQSQNVEGLSVKDVRVIDQAQTLRFVSRGGLKLEAAVLHLAINVKGWRCFDVGISTGGFSDFLLKNGAAAVLGVDVGHGQLHKNLNNEPRLQSLEGTHVKDLPQNTAVQDWLSAGVDLCVVDVSFISLEQVLPTLKEILPSGCRLLALVKPQFEVGPKTLKAEMFDDVQNRILRALDKCGFSCLEYFSSSVRGQDGNQEFFVWAVRS